MNEILEVTPGLQCCLRCGRVLTDRALHDILEEPVLATIRAKRQGEASGEETCQPCLEEYRSLLNDRQTRSARMAEEAVGSRPSWMGKLFGKQVYAGRVF